MTIPEHIAALILMVLMTGCVSRPPTIAHVHLGHALTAVHVTPNREGYLVVAYGRAREANEAARKLRESTTVEEMKTHAAAVLLATSSEDNFGLQQAVVLASNHVSFAATSDDASHNIQDSAPIFARDITRIVERCELIVLLGNDIAASTSTREALVSADEILKLTTANLDGEDLDADGAIGSTPAEFGIKQLRSEFDGIIARESPPYQTVDRWYLFNLVRLPSGRWVFDKLSRNGNINGYK